jgi:glucuronoarabinoxylan endo-1,4-beta-xylanase
MKMKRLRILGFLLTLVVCHRAQAQTATVTWSTQYQTMDGFGAQTWSSANSLTGSQAQIFFSPTTGIGLEYVRTANTADGSVPDLVTLQQAAALGAKVELSLQSPPASMKVSGSFTDGTGGINTADYGAYATYIVNWIKMLQSEGVPVSVLDVQNEPDITDSSVGACIWTAAQLDTFIGNYLGPALASAGLSSVQLMLGSASYWFNDLVSTCLNDSTCAQYVTIASAHGYGDGGVPDGFSPQSGYCCSTVSAAPSSTSSKRVWQSEINGGFAYNDTAGLWNWDPSMSDAIVWARNIHDYLTIAGASGWEYWELADCCSSESGAPFNDGLVDTNFDSSKRMYVIGQWSKFVRSGWVRIDATASPASGVYVTAFSDPTSGQFAIVAINQNSSTINLGLTLGGFPSATSVTPTLTSASVNLEDQATLSVSDGAFSYSLPGTSVVTLHGTASSSPSNSSQPPLPPKGLTAAVR